MPAAILLLQASDVAPHLRKVPEFKYDLVDVTRQLLVNRFIDLYLDLLNVYSSSSTSSNDVSVTGSRLVRLVDDLDRLLYTDENFLLSTWISDAQQWARQGSRTNASYAAYLEFNARNQLTLWGPNGEINDYASKQWAGLVEEYYSERWSMFVGYLAGLKENDGTYNDTVIAQQLLSFGQEWQNRTWGNAEGETLGTKGDTFEVVRDLLHQWG